MFWIIYNLDEIIFSDTRFDDLATNVDNSKNKNIKYAID